jgi:hypothetical protein
VLLTDAVLHSVASREGETKRGREREREGERERGRERERRGERGAIEDKGEEKGDTAIEGGKGETEGGERARPRERGRVSEPDGGREGERKKSVRV